jgi:DNA-binding IclR family transcriptional regulator
MATQQQYLSDSQQRVIKTILALFSDVVQGVAPSVLAKHVECDPAQMTRTLSNLQYAGIAERDETTGLWRLTPRLPQQAIKVWTAIDRAEARLQQAKNRFNRAGD